MFPNIYKLSSSSFSSLPSSLWWGWGSCYLFSCCSLHMLTWVVGYIDIVIYTGWPKKYFARYKFSVVVVDLPWRCLGANVLYMRGELSPCLRTDPSGGNFATIRCPTAIACIVCSNGKTVAPILRYRTTPVTSVTSADAIAVPISGYSLIDEIRCLSCSVHDWSPLSVAYQQRKLSG